MLTEGGTVNETDLRSGLQSIAADTPDLNKLRSILARAAVRLTVVRLAETYSDSDDCGLQSGETDLSLMLIQPTLFVTS